MRRRELALAAAWLAGGCGATAAPATGFALVPPGAVLSPHGAAAAAIRRAAGRVATRAPHAMARVHVEGTLPHQGIHDESVEALRDLPAARDLAIAGRAFSDPSLAAAAARIAGAWASTYAPAYNPIDDTGFEALFIAWDLLDPPLRAPHADAMATLLHRFAAYPVQPVKGATAVNNWNSHRVKLAVMAAFATGDARLATRAHDAFIAQLRANIGPDGLTFDFTQRDALHYVVYDLEPLAMAVLCARRHGQDWWSDAEGRLGRAVAWLAPYLTGATSHEEFVHSSVDFDRARREAGLKGFGGPFDPAVGRTLMAMVARIDPDWRGLAERLHTAPWQDAWLDVIWLQA